MLVFRISYREFVVSFIVATLLIISIEYALIGVALPEWTILVRMFIYHFVFFIIYTARLTTLGINWVYSLIIMISFIFEARVLILLGMDLSGWLYSVVGGIVIIMSVIFMIWVFFLKKLS